MNQRKLENIPSHFMMKVDNYVQFTSSQGQQNWGARKAVGAPSSGKSGA